MSLFDLEQAMHSIGHPMYSDEFCCEVLAWLFTIGGNTEMAVMNEALRQVLLIAQERLNIKGGEVPDKGLVLIWRDKIKEIESAIKHGQNDVVFPDWLLVICERYNLNAPRPHVDYDPDKSFDVDKFLDGFMLETVIDEFMEGV